MKKKFVVGTTTTTTTTTITFFDCFVEEKPKSGYMLKILKLKKFESFSSIA